MLGPASSNGKDPNEELPPPQLMILADLQKGSGGEGYNPYSALVDSGTTYNFIVQAVTDQLGL